jgi:protein O-mannosyl-transferase
MRPALAFASLTGIVALVFAPTATFEFINFDDPDYVLENAAVRGGGLAGIVWAFTHVHAANWHPLTWISHMLDWYWFGAAAGGHHLVNVAWHALATGLVCWALWRATETLGPTLLAGALFGLHPTRVESVAWIAERKDVLSTALWALTLCAYVDWVRRPQRARYVAALACFAAALLAKPMVVTLPALLLVLDWWPLERLTPVTFWPRLREKLPFFGLAAATSVATVMAQQVGGAVMSLASAPFTTRVGNALVAYVRYLGLLVWPVDLAPFYPYRTWPGATVAGAAAILVALSALALLAARRHPYVLVGWLWYLGTLLPVSGLFQVGSQAMADRFTYVPATGLFVACAWGLADLGTRWRAPWLLPVVGTAVVVACLPLTIRQLAHWHDSETLFRHAVAVTRDNAVAHNSLGRALRERHADADAEAEWHFREAIRLSPTSPIAYVNLGTVLGRAGTDNTPQRLAEAEAALRRAMELAPTLVGAPNTLAGIVERRGDLAAARTLYERAIALDPQYAAVRANFGDYWRRQGRVDEAIAQYRVAAALHPEWADVQHHLGLLYADRGESVAAVEHLTAALAADPASVATAAALAWILATDPDARVRDGATAVRLGEQLRAAVNPPEASLLDVLAAAYAEAGRFGDAVATAEAAQQALTAATAPDLAAGIATRLAAYRTGQPHRASHPPR